MHGAVKLIVVRKRKNTRTLYVTRKGSRLTSAQSSIQRWTLSSLIINYGQDYIMNK